MPRTTFSDSRALIEQRSETIYGRECDVRVYSETYSKPRWTPFGLYLRARYGTGEWEARHVRVDVPTDTGEHVRHVHDSRGRSHPTELAPLEEHVQDALDEVSELIESGRAGDATCH